MSGRRWASTALATLVVVLLSACGTEPTGSRPERTQHAEFAATDLVTHDRVGMADLAGHPALLVSWASWCGECRTELPSLQRYYDSLGKGHRLKVIAVDLDSDGASYNVRKAVYESGLTMPVWVDPKNTFRAAFGTLGVPTTVLLDETGAVAQVWPGATDFDDPQIQQAISDVVASRSRTD